MMSECLKVSVIMTRFKQVEKQKQQLNQSFILHSYPYKESSLILNVLTYENGRVNLLAKGVKSSKKGLLSLLQPFQQLLLSYSLKQELAIMTGVERSPHSMPSLSGKGLYCGYYLNELLLRLLALHDPHETIYQLYQHSLLKLQSGIDLEAVLRSFEVQLLEQLGYQLNLEFDIFSEQMIEPNKSYFFDPRSGPFEMTDKIQNELPLSKNLELFPLVSGKSLLALRSLDFKDKNVAHECKNLLRLVLREYLGTQPLKSRNLFKQLYGKQEK